MIKREEEQHPVYVILSKDVAADNQWWVYDVHRTRESANLEIEELMDDPYRESEEFTVVLSYVSLWTKEQEEEPEEDIYV